MNSYSPLHRRNSIPLFNFMFAEFSCITYSRFFFLLAHDEICFKLYFFFLNHPGPCWSQRGLSSWSLLLGSRPCMSLIQKIKLKLEGFLAVRAVQVFSALLLWHVSPRTPHVYCLTYSWKEKTSDIEYKLKT